MMKYPFSKGNRIRRGFALVSTLLVLSMLTIVAVAFMQSMRMDHLTVRGYLNKTKAEFAVRAAAEKAASHLLVTDGICLVTGYERRAVSYKSKPCSAPYLIAYELNGDATTISARHFLCSALDPAKGPLSTTGSDATDINAPMNAMPDGLLGLKQDDEITRQQVPVDWIYMKDDSGNTVARYAYWIDDECAKINLRTAEKLVDPCRIPPDYTHVHRAGSDPWEVSLYPVFVPQKTAEAIGRLNSFLNLRNSYPDLLMSLFSAAQMLGGNYGGADFEKVRVFVCLDSKGDERGAIGLRKINLNDFVQSAMDVTTSEGRDEIVNHVVALGDYIKTALPGFGTRYYKDASEDEQRLYCIKLAANIQDYIDSDSQPTVIRHDLKAWQEPPDPAVVGAGAPDLPPAVFGKEVVPAIGEYVGYYYNDNGFLRIDHSFEVWNIHCKDIEIQKLGNVRILMSERDIIQLNDESAGTPPVLPGSMGNPPLTLTIPQASVLKAGCYTLLTTLPEVPPLTVPVGKNPNTWNVKDATPVIRLNRNEPVYPYGSNGLKMTGDGPAIAADADTEICVMNDYGYLDIQPRVAQEGPVTFTLTNSQYIASQSFGNSSSGSGNNTNRGYPLDSGDPRSLTEIYPDYGEEPGAISMIAWRRNTTNTHNTTVLGGDSSGIKADNPVGLSRDCMVPEPVGMADLNDPLRAVSVIRDGPMKTPGELGFIYDPAVPGDGWYNKKTRNRGGFRTLAIGSKQGELTGPNPLTPQITPHNRAHRLLELFTTSSQSQGLIHINSVLRDHRNLPLRAVLENYTSQSNDAADTNFASPRDPTFSQGKAVNADKFIEALRQQVKNNGPFFNLGQLGDLDIFNTGTELFMDGTSMTPDSRFTDHLNRGREEIFRNLVGLLALKGSVFKIYCLGQSGQMINGRFVALADCRLTQTVELTRTYKKDNPIAECTLSGLCDNNRPLKSSCKIINMEFYR